MNDDSKNLYRAIILSLVIIFVTNHFFFKKEVVKETPQVTISTPIEEKNTEKTDDIVPLTTAQAVESNPHILIKNNSLSGSFRTNGFRIDNLSLNKYKQTLDTDSESVELLVPSKTKNPYYSEFGWLSADKNIIVPDSKTLWTVKGKDLTPTTPVVLEWENGQGIKFITKISIDDNYMFTINQSFENNTDKSISLFPYGLITRSYGLEQARSVVHEGMIGVLDNNLEEIKYDDLKKENKEFTTKEGWLGFSDRYWFSAIILDSHSQNNAKFSKTGKHLYQADFVGSAVTAAQGSIGSSQIMFYAGAKEIKLLDDYTSNLNINKFDLAVDFGWYYFLTKPFFYILDFLYNILGNMGWAILLFAALLRLVMFPIANKSYENMAKMKKLQPKLKDLQEKYQDKAKLQIETMELYRREKINPAAGCLPMFIQIPIFFSLYKVLNIAIEIRHAPFIGWIKDLSAPDPLTLSVITHLPIPAIFNIGIWPIIMGLTMYIQQKLNPAPANKDQARMFAMLPIIFTFMMGHFASGLVIYWTLSNFLSIIQQKAIINGNKD